MRNIIKKIGMCFFRTEEEIEYQKMSKLIKMRYNKITENMLPRNLSYIPSAEYIPKWDVSDEEEAHLENSQFNLWDVPLDEYSRKFELYEHTLTLYSDIDKKLDTITWIDKISYKDIDFKGSLDYCFSTLYVLLNYNDMCMIPNLRPEYFRPTLGGTLELNIFDQEDDKSLLWFLDELTIEDNIATDNGIVKRSHIVRYVYTNEHINTQEYTYHEICLKKLKALGKKLNSIKLNNL
tara:strand:- start:3262 stop:3969 length:708 start_codon:yes stop_codon:yes gene_type:complete